MNKQKAIKKIRRKLTRAKPCPFCGSLPTFSLEFFGVLSWGRCCVLLGPGSLVIPMRDRANHNPGAWWRNVSLHVDLWNKRHRPPSFTPTARSKRLTKRVLAAAKVYPGGIGAAELDAIYRYHKANENARTRTVIYYHA